MRPLDMSPYRTYRAMGRSCLTRPIRDNRVTWVWPEPKVHRNGRFVGRALARADVQAPAELWRAAYPEAYGSSHDFILRTEAYEDHFALAETWEADQIAKPCCMLVAEEAATGRLAAATIARGISLILIQVRSPMLFAVGMYLPLETTFAIFVGGMLRGYVDRQVKKREYNAAQSSRVENTGVLVASGLIAGEAPEQLEDVTLSLDGISRRFRLTLLQADTARRALRVGLEIETLAQSGVAAAATGRGEVEFEVGYFSTPMIDNTRLSNDQRVAVVLTDINPAGANLSLVLFPSSRASLREKPYYEEILRKLTETALPGGP